MRRGFHIDQGDIATLKIIGLVLFFIFSMFLTFGILGLIHEAGHARACIALGGNVGGFRAWLRKAWNQQPSTDCSIRPYPPLVWAGGDIATIVSWFALALILSSLVKHALIKPGRLASIVWACWSYWYLVTLANELYHTYSAPSLWEDTTQFVRNTHINPNLVGVPLAAILLISIWIWGRIQYSLLPEFISWHRFSHWLWTAPHQ